jgi:hypothetical protein
MDLCDLGNASLRHLVNATHTLQDVVHFIAIRVHPYAVPWREQSTFGGAEDHLLQRHGECLGDDIYAFLSA